MSRRGRSGPAISLFSFQDIITSVTAIVTVIALLLALDLVQRKQSETKDTSRQIAIELAERIAAADAELAQLNTTVEFTDNLVQEIAETSPVELSAEIAHRESAISALKEQELRLEKQAQQWLARIKEKEVEQFELDPLRKKTEDALQEAAELEQQQAAVDAENRTVFSLPRGFQKEGWIAVIDQQLITVAPLGRPAKPVVLTATGLPLLGNSAAEELVEWLDRQQLRSAYFLLLVRPDASLNFHEVQELFSKKRLSYGFDLIGQDDAIMHPERGAAP